MEHIDGQAARARGDDERRVGAESDQPRGREREREINKQNVRRVRVPKRRSGPVVVASLKCVAILSRSRGRDATIRSEHQYWCLFLFIKRRSGQRMEAFLFLFRPFRFRFVCAARLRTQCFVFTFGPPRSALCARNGVRERGARAIGSLSAK